MKNGKKKKWVRPQLIILTRARSEEAVLAGCKGDIDISATINHSNCAGQNGCPDPCYDVVTT